MTPAPLRIVRRAVPPHGPWPDTVPPVADQVTGGTAVEPSLHWPPAENCWVPPAGTVAVVRLDAPDGRMVSVAGAERPRTRGAYMSSIVAGGAAKVPGNCARRT